MAHAPFARFYLQRLVRSPTTSNEIPIDRLMLQDREMCDDDCRILAGALKEGCAVASQHPTYGCSTLTEISIRGNQAVTCDGVQALLETLVEATRTYHADVCPLHLVDLRDLSTPLDAATARLLEVLTQQCDTLRDVLGSFDSSCEDVAGRISFKTRLNQQSKRLKEAAVEATKPTTEMRSIDLSHLDKPFTIESAKLLEEALVNNLQVTRLDLRGNKCGDAVFAQLCSLFSSNRCLQEVSLADNALTSLSASAIASALIEGKNHTLVELDLSDNEISDQGCQSFFNVAHSEVCDLGMVHMDRNCVTPTLLARLHEALTVHAQPTRLREIVPSLQENSGSLVRVVLSNAHLDDVSMRVCLHAMRNNTSVTFLDVSNNSVADDGAQYLSELITSSSPLKKVIAQCNNIHDPGALSFIRAVPQSPVLELVDLRFQAQPITAVLLDRLAWLVSSNHHPVELRQCGLQIMDDDPSLECLHLDACHISDKRRPCTAESIQLLANMCSSNTHLKELYAGNHATSLTSAALPSLLDLSVRLQLLDLQNCGFGDEATEYFVAMLRATNSQLKTLNLHSNRLTDVSGQLLRNALQADNHTLTRLDVGGNNISVGVVDEIAYLCDLNTHPPAFKSLVLALASNDPKCPAELSFAQYEKINIPQGTSHRYKKEFGDVSVRLLCHALQVNSTVTSLDFSGNRVTDVGAQDIARMLRCNCTITNLNLAYNEISDAGLQAISRAMGQNHAVHIFVFNGNPFKDPNMQKTVNSNLSLNPSNRVNAYNALQARSTPSAGTLEAAEYQRRVADAIFADAMIDLKRTATK